MKIIVNDADGLDVFKKDDLIKILHFLGFEDIEFISETIQISEGYGKRLAKELCDFNYYYSETPGSIDKPDVLAKIIGLTTYDDEKLEELVIAKVLEKGGLEV